VKKTLVAIALFLFTLSAAQAQKLTGAGSTFDYPIFSKWFSEYSAAHPGVQINYQSIGSGGGIRQFCSGVVDFGASDMPMTEEMISGCKINNWNDPAIARDNPGVKLPNQRITVVHRSDGSGTSFIWTDYLSKVSAEWKQGPGSGTSPAWPTGVGGKGNEGVSGLVRQLPGSIGYVELIYALQNHIATGAVKNAAGQFVTASLDSTTAAAASMKQIPDDLRFSITNPPGGAAYPISSFSWIIAPQADPTTANGKVLIDLLSWIVKSGQSESASLSYAPLPQNVAEKDLKVIYSLKP
jgi:phosphate transport system substrate-binding protein